MPGPFAFTGLQKAGIIKLPAAAGRARTGRAADTCKECAMGAGRDAMSNSMMEKVRRSPLKAVRSLLLTAALCVVVGGACFWSGRLTAGGEPEPQLSAVVLEGRLAEVRELAGVTYAYTNMAQFQSSNEFYGMKLPFTTKKFILTYDGVIKAGVDLKQAAVTVEGTEVTVNLPNARILSHELDEDSVEVFDEKTSIFNPFTIEDFTAFQADQKAAMEERALERGLLEEAQLQAENSIRALLAPVVPDSYTLTVCS